MATTSVVYRDGKAIRTTVLSATDADKFVILAAAVRDAQNVMRNKPEKNANGDALKGVTHDANVPYSESAPDDIYSVLPRLAELLGKHPRAVYSHLDEAVNGEVIRNADGTPAYGLKLAHKNTPVPAPFHPAAALASSASALGMIPLDGLAFDRTELIVDGVAAAPTGITQVNGVAVAATGAMVGGSIPTVRAFVRFRG